MHIDYFATNNIILNTLFQNLNTLFQNLNTHVYSTTRNNIVLQLDYICLVIKNLYQYYYYSCVFGKRNFSVLVRVSVCVCVSVFVCVCFCTITQKEIDLGTRNRNTL